MPPTSEQPDNGVSSVPIQPVAAQPLQTNSTSPLPPTVKKPVWKQILWGVVWAVIILFVLLAIAAAFFFFKAPQATSKVQDSLRTADLANLQAELEIYNATTGTYPSSLNQLVPQYIVSVPTDPASNAPYQYQTGQNNASYTLCAELTTGQDCVNSSTTDGGGVSSSTSSTTAASSIASESWSSYTFNSTVSSIPGFTLKYPTSWGQPKASEDASNPEMVTIEFHPFDAAEYAQAQQEYPDALQVPLEDMNMSIMLFQKSFTQLMAQEYPGTTPQNPNVGSLGASRYISTTPRSIFGVNMSLNENETDYVMQLLNGSSLYITVTGDPKFRNDADASGNSTRDKIVESIQFTNPSL